MKILGLDISISRSKPSTPDTTQTRSLDPRLLDWICGNEPRRQTPDLANALEQVPWVYRCVNVLAEQIANIRRALCEEISSYRHGDGYVVPMPALLATGTKAA